MAISLNGGTGVITGVSVGGLPDGIVDTDTLADDAVTDPKQNLSGVAKAWVCFNGSAGAVAIRKAYNVASVTENATGDYTINFTTAMSDTNYAVTTTGHTKLTANSDQRVLGLDEGGTYTTSAVQITNRYYAGASFSGCTHAGVAIFN